MPAGCVRSLSRHRKYAILVGLICDYNTAADLNSSAWDQIARLWSSFIHRQSM